MNDARDLSTTCLAPEKTTLNQAKRIIGRYLASFPAGQGDDEGYAASLVDLLCEYPHWAAERVMRLALNTFKFPPHRAELRPLLEAEIQYLRIKDRYEQQAASQTAEREKPRERMTAEEMHARWGKNWGLNGGKRPADESEQARQWLIERFGQDALDRVPDAPHRFRRVGQ